MWDSADAREDILVNHVKDVEMDTSSSHTAKTVVATLVTQKQKYVRQVPVHVCVRITLPVNGVTDVRRDSMDTHSVPRVTVRLLVPNHQYVTLRRVVVVASLTTKG
jgi:hypothetical protein